jgi:protein ImuA
MSALPVLSPDLTDRAAPGLLRADVWRADALAAPRAQTLSSGDAALDAQLPGGGWPVGALTELLQAPGAHNEWRLLLPALARSGTGPVVLVAPPHLPFAPALQAQGLQAQRLLWLGAADSPDTAALWLSEQALRCAAVYAVLAWLPQVRPEQLRRLQWAAAEHHKLLFVLRPEVAQAQASPAVLRLLLDVADSAALSVQILKRRGPPLAEPLHLAARAPALLRVLASAKPTTATTTTTTTTATATATAEGESPVATSAHIAREGLHKPPSVIARPQAVAIYGFMDCRVAVAPRSDGKFVIASAAKQSSSLVESRTDGSPRRCAPRDDGYIQSLPSLQTRRAAT